MKRKRPMLNVEDLQGGEILDDVEVCGQEQMMDDDDDEDENEEEAKKMTIIKTARSAMPPPPRRPPKKRPRVEETTMPMATTMIYARGGDDVPCILAMQPHIDRSMSITLPAPMILECNVLLRLQLVAQTHHMLALIWGVTPLLANTSTRPCTDDCIRQIVEKHAYMGAAQIALSPDKRTWIAVLDQWRAGLSLSMRMTLAGDMASTYQQYGFSKCALAAEGGASTAIRLHLTVATV